MSIQAMSWVLEHSTAEHSARLVHIALANHANGDGEDSYPSIGRIARETRLGESTVRAAIERLKRDGMIVEVGISPKRTRRFRLLLYDPAESAPPQNLHPRRNGQPTPQNLAPDPAESAPEPPLEPPLEPSPLSSPTGAEQERPDVARICHLLADSMLANDPKAKVQPDGRRWRDAARLLLDRDGRDLEIVERVIRWSQADSFWRGNILSMPTLREKFAQLALKMDAGPPPPGAAATPDRFAKYDDAARRSEPDDLCAGHGRTRDANGVCTLCHRADLRRVA